MLHNSNKETILKEEIRENTLAIYLEDKQINYIPEKDSGYTLDLTKSSCNNGVEISFDYNTWSVKTNYSNYTNTDNTRVKCSLYFKKRTFAESLVDCGALSKDAGTCIKENYYLTDEVVDDETVDNNLRFIGSDPDNYVWFNDELWRIIGVMNNIDDGTGNIETRLKIIRSEPIGQYSWDYNSDGSYGNDWSTSTLMNLLNTGAYYNSTIGSYYNNSTTTTTVDFTSTGLTQEAKEMINNAVWNLGGSSTYNDVTTDMFYERERKTEVYNNNPATWVGKIGIMYVSDYGYATGGNITDREECLKTALYNWYNADFSTDSCFKNNWLYNSKGTQWTIVSYPYEFGVFRVYSNGGIGPNPTMYSDYVSPVSYLSSHIRITSGVGTKEQPYLLSL